MSIDTITLGGGGFGSTVTHETGRSRLRRRIRVKTIGFVSRENESDVTGPVARSLRSIAGYFTLSRVVDGVQLIR